MEGGVLYDFLPNFMQNSTYYHAQAGIPSIFAPLATEYTPTEDYCPIFECDYIPESGYNASAAFEPDEIETEPIDLYEYEPDDNIGIELLSLPEYYHEHDYVDDHLAYAEILYALLSYYYNPETDEYELPYVPVPCLDDFLSIPAPPMPYEEEPETHTVTRPPPPPPRRAYPQDASFDMISFFIAENAYYYAYFHYNHPYLSAEDVVWKVNAHLHLPFHYNIRINYDENPLLVNPSYRLPPGFSPPNMVPVNNPNCNLRGTPEAVAAFHRMRETAGAAGYYLSITSAYRTAARQGQLFSNRNYVDGVVARPYHSEHQTGRALDLWGAGGLLDARGPSPTGRWVAANAHYYGFVIRYGATTTHITGFIHEPWHITYVGIYIAMYMHYNNILSLEEFVGRHPGATMGWTYPHEAIEEES